MKNKTKTLSILLPAVLAGILGYILRTTLYRVGFDQRGLLARMHPLQLSCVLLSLAAALWAAVLTGKRDLGYRPVRYLHPAARGILAPVVCACVLLHGWKVFSPVLPVLTGRGAPEILTLIQTILSLGAGVSVLVLLWFNPRKPLVDLACHSILCLFFVLDMLYRYQNWSGEPQIADYLLQVFACVSFSLCSYSRMALSGGISKPRLHGIASILGVVLGILCAAGPEHPAFYIGGAAWCALGIMRNDSSNYFFSDTNQEETP